MNEPLKDPKLQIPYPSALCCRGVVPKENGNKSSYSQYLPLFWPVRQSRAAKEPHLSLSQNAHLQTIVYG